MENWVGNTKNQFEIIVGNWKYRTETKISKIKTFQLWTFQFLDISNWISQQYVSTTLKNLQQNSGISNYTGLISQLHVIYIVFEFWSTKPNDKGQTRRIIQAKTLQ